MLATRCSQSRIRKERPLRPETETINFDPMPRSPLNRVSWIALIACSAAGGFSQITIEGVVRFEAEVPKGPPDEAGEVHDLLEVDRQTRGLRYVVAHLLATTSSPALQQPDISYRRETNATVSASSPTSVEIEIRARNASWTNAALEPSNRARKEVP